MKRKNLLLALTLALLALPACSRVEPNNVGVLQENFGKAGKDDFSLVQGSVITIMPGTKLYQVPLYEQRGGFDKPTTLKGADNTEFSTKPSYSYKVNKDRAVDVVFNNGRLEGENGDFLDNIEDNILEPRIYDIVKDVSRNHTTEELMMKGGSANFENEVQKRVTEEFNKQGLELISFTSQLEFTQNVKERIDKRNEVQQNIAVLEQQIIEQQKRNELAELQAQENIIRSKGLTDEILKEKFIETWGGKVPLYGQDVPLVHDVSKK